jgi:hypothetical protein
MAGPRPGGGRFRPGNPGNPNATGRPRLTPADEIYRLADAGLSPTEIARELGISRGQVNRDLANRADREAGLSASLAEDAPEPGRRTNRDVYGADALSAEQMRRLGLGATGAAGAGLGLAALSGEEAEAAPRLVSADPRGLLRSRTAQRTYQLDLPSGRKVEMYVGPSPSDAGKAQVEWYFPGSPDASQISRADALAAFRGAGEMLQADAQRYGRPTYQFAPASDAHGRIYETMLRQAAADYRPRLGADGMELEPTADPLGYALGIAAAGAGGALALSGEAEASPFSSLRQEAGRPLSAEDMDPIELDGDIPWNERAAEIARLPVGASDFVRMGRHTLGLGSPETDNALAGFGDVLATGPMMPFEFGRHAAADWLDHPVATAAEWTAGARARLLGDVTRAGLDASAVEAMPFWDRVPSPTREEAADFRMPYFEDEANPFQQRIMADGERGADDIFLDAAFAPLETVPDISTAIARRALPAARNLSEALIEPDFPNYRPPAERMPAPDIPLGRDTGWNAPDPRTPEGRARLFEVEPDTPPPLSERDIYRNALTRMAEGITDRGDMTRADFANYPQSSVRQDRQIYDRGRLIDAANNYELTPPQLTDLAFDVMGGAGDRWTMHARGFDPLGRDSLGLGLQSVFRFTDDEAARLREIEQARIPQTAGSVDWDPRLVTPGRARAAMAAGGALMLPMLAADQNSLQTPEAIPGPPQRPVLDHEIEDQPRFDIPEPAPDVTGAERAARGGGLPYSPDGAVIAPELVSLDAFEAMFGGRLPSSDSEQPVDIAPDDTLFPAFEFDARSNDHIRRLQRALADAGFDPGPIDGRDGPQTRAALEQLGAAYGEGPPTDLGRALRMAAAFPTRDASVADIQDAFRRRPDLAAILEPYGVDDDYGSRTERASEVYTGEDAPAFGSYPDADWRNALYYERMLGNRRWRDQLRSRTK